MTSKKIRLPAKAAFSWRLSVVSASSNYFALPAIEGASEITEIPGPLFELVEALLKNRHGDPSSLYSLFDQRGEIENAIKP